MELDERKLKILQAIVRNYLETGEPVGSRTISKYTDLHLSSATIRNEMSDLEELGYILQPHTSAGRIPSDKGYRLYVDTMMDQKEQEVEDMKELLVSQTDRMDLFLKQLAKHLAMNTNYASVVTKPHYQHKKIKFIQLTRVDEWNLLTVIVLDNNSVKNQVISLKECVEEEMVAKLNFVLNTTLNGLDITEINIALIQQMKKQFDGQEYIVNAVLDAVSEAVTEDDETEIYTSGATNMLKYPELSDKEKVTELLGAFEEKKMLHELISIPSETVNNHDIQVYIGDESPVASMKDCSVVTATYRVEDGVYGKIGIVGPKRMDYEKVVHTLQSLMVQLDDIFRDKN